MYAVILAVFFLIVMSVWTLWQVRRDFEERGSLKPETVAGVLAFYTLHLAIELIAAWARLWPYQRFQTGSVILGLIFCLLGGVFLALGTLHMENFQQISGIKTGELITSGIYRWSRHPQNLGWGLFLVGAGFLSRSLLALLLSAVFWVILVAYVPIEEAYLEEIHGQDYRQYQQRTNRYLGLPMRDRDEDKES
ncbi:MAG: isoprenylcysteine carboxylmethyltransferase family protein [Anaerolineales bacterium]